MKTIWDSEVRDSLMQRLARIGPHTPALWGRMTAGEMVAHLAQGMRLALGEISAAPRRSPFRYWPLKYLFVYFVPFPKRAPAPREFVTRGKPVAWDQALESLTRVMQELAIRDGKGSWPPHPVFGALSGRAWGALGWRHFDHHLRQFGV